MIGGFLKSTSGLALLAATGVVVGGVTAQAADLGGNCCADLEERVAELEATTVRKGNRKVSLQLYGSVSETVMWWNDGMEKNVYVGENQAVRNLMGVTGSAKINNDWSAGYKIEWQFRAARSSAWSQQAFGNDAGVTLTAFGTQSLNLRDVHWYVESQTYGRITVGRTLDAVAGIATINLANPDGYQGNGFNMGFAQQGFFLRRKGTPGHAGLSAVTQGNFTYISNGDSPASFDYAQTGSQIKYTSPFFLGQTKNSGFQFSANWGEDDYWTTALRYVEDFGTFRFAAGVGYSDWRDVNRGGCANATTAQPSQAALVGGNPGVAAAGGTASTALTGLVSNVNCNAVKGSASLMHTPTGLYVSGGGGYITDNNRQTLLNLQLNGGSSGVINKGINADKNDGAWWIQAGWETKLNSLGKTTFYGTYTQYNTGLRMTSNVLGTVASNDVINSLGQTAIIAGTQTTQWGLGITQAVDAAAMNFYMGYMHTATSGSLITSTGVNSTITGTFRAKALGVGDFDVFYTGASIKF